MNVNIRSTTGARIFVALTAAFLGWLAVDQTVSAGIDVCPPAPPVEALNDDDYRVVDLDQARLGRLLFYDKILSGNRNISCGTCHHHDHASADGLSLPIGEGGVGVGPERTPGTGDARIHRRVSRHSPALFNIGARQIEVLFHDGRVAISGWHPSGFNTPAKDDLPQGLANVVAAQAMFPVTSHTEMAGSHGENEVASAARGEIDHVWPLLAERLRQIPGYEALFVAAFDDIDSSLDITFVHAANALAAFQQLEWRADNSPFDAYARGDPDALTARQLDGMELFFGSAGCARCHSGALFTDQGFHAIAMPQFGPGRTRPFDSVARDRGRINETNRLGDTYKFRTPSLRNVAATAPYGHTGAYTTLESVIRHHMDPVAGYQAWTPDQAVLPKVEELAKVDFVIMSDQSDVSALLRANELRPMHLDDAEIANLVAFLHALTDEQSLAGTLGRPTEVPSGLPVD